MPVATTVRTIYQQPSAAEVHAQHARVVEQLQERFRESSGITVVAASDPAQGLRRALTDIVAARAKRGRSTGEVMVLGRDRHSRTLLPRHAPGNLRLRFATVHAAKGLEADDVVVWIWWTDSSASRRRSRMIRCWRCSPPGSRQAIRMRKGDGSSMWR